MSTAPATLDKASILAKIQHKMAAMPKTPPEDSLLLRVLVQLMVIVGIIAMDVAAETSLSWWTIPLSIAGSTWSWYHRGDRNIGVKFALAFAMVGALGYFVWHLVGSINDTRLVLAELLIQMQTIHTWDLPRRKDLGYSMTIGLISIGVAGTLSQTLAFAPLLLLFLAIAIPVLFLDYRSRLQLTPIPVATPTDIAKVKLPWRKLGQLLGIVLAIGLIIFALMPRFPGYQGSLPVSAPIQYEAKQFDGKGIVNPGNRQKGKSGGKKSAPTIDDKGNEQQGEDKEDKLDDSSYYGFNTQINQNSQGVMKPKLVMRVRSQAPGFWRALAFDRYTGKGWEISRNEKTRKIQRPDWEYKFTIGHPATKNQTKQVIQSYTALEELPNIIPGMSLATEVYFPTSEIAIDKEGSLRSPVGLIQGLTYTVVSQVPFRDRSLLDKAKTDYAPDIRDYYLQIPTTIAPKLKQYTQSLVDKYPQQQVTKNPEPLSSNYAKVLYLAQYLKQHYTVPQTFDRVPEGEDLVNWFLFRCEGKSTSCETGGSGDRFATTYTMMLRSIGIPARLAVGFDSGRFNPFTGYYEVYNTDAHALTEVYFPEYGWFAFDPIPGHPLTPPGADEDQTFSTIQQLWNWVAGFLPSPVTAWLAQIWSLTLGWLVVGIAWFFSLFSRGWLGIFVGTAISIAVSYGGWFGWQQWVKWRHLQWLKKLPPVERVYQQMLSQLRDRGIPKHPAQTPLEYAQVVRDSCAHSIGIFVTDISIAYTAWRYGEEAQEVEELQELLGNLKRDLSAVKEIKVGGLK
jgi:transglutaminase-like putative cysteine protease